MAQVLIPTPHRKFVDGKAQVDVEGTTIGELINGLTQAHPDLKKHLLNDDGSVRSFVNIFHNEDDIRMLENMKTEVGEKDTISIIPAIAGGLS